MNAGHAYHVLNKYARRVHRRNTYSYILQYIFNEVDEKKERRSFAVLFFVHITNKLSTVYDDLAQSPVCEVSMAHFVREVFFAMR